MNDRPDLDPDEGRWAPPSDAPAASVPASTPAAYPPPAPSVPPPPPTVPPAAPGPATEPFGAPVDPVVAQHGPSSHRSGGRHTSGWVWPLVAVIALVVGVVGGVAGGAGYAHWFGDDDNPTTTTVGGLDTSDLTTAPPLQKPGSVARVAQEVLPSTVQVLAEYQGVEAGATGSGFVLDSKGNVVTNNHVVADAAENDGPIEVVDQDGNQHDATVVGRSPVYDLAVLHVADAGDLKPASLGRSRALRVGEPVVAIGAPLGLSSTVTSGIVSALNRPVTTGSTSDDSSYINAVQTDAAINPGNSGGPLVNLQGQVVGVNSAIATNGGGSFDEEAGNIGVGFAIPVEQVIVTADQILATGEAQYPVIGARVQVNQVTSFDGATVDEVLKDSPAEKAGLKNGDLITAVNGARVTDGIALIVAIRTHQPGETIEFTVERDGGERTVDITLDGEVG